MPGNVVANAGPCHRSRGSSAVGPDPGRHAPPLRNEGADETPVHEALREAVVNALVHADHEGDGGISECRNKSIQRMFQMIGGGEKAGSGVDKILSGWRSQHWRVPTLREVVRPDRVELALPMVSLLDGRVLDDLKARFGEGLGDLSEIEVAALVVAHESGHVNNRRLREQTGAHPTDVTRALQSLVQRGFLERHGRARGSTYALPGAEGVDLEDWLAPDFFAKFFGGSVDPDAMEQLRSLFTVLAGPADVVVAEDGPSSAQRASRSAQSASSSAQSASSSAQSASSSAQSARDSTQSPAVNATHSTQRADGATPSGVPRTIATGDWTPRAEMASAILAFCAEWQTPRAIAAALNRSGRHLRERYLNPMVDEGTLEIRYADRKNHPDQAYRTRDNTL